MAAESSFDIVSKLDSHEVDNAINQAVKEVGQRFDFKNTDSSITKKGDAIELESISEERLAAVLDVLRSKLARRNVDLLALDPGPPKLSGKRWRQVCTLAEGISQDNAKKITALLRAEGPKGVKAQIQGDELRVSSKSRDELQAVQQLIKKADFDFAVQFVNYR